jgi:BirA family biotin operon repressor/biotin-[acetyl-CoA-carboxylase] ligase
LDAHQPHPGSLALVAGLAVQAALAPWVPAPLLPLLKWPNDVMIGAAKLAGILLEVVGEAVVVGVGVNLAVAPNIAGREVVALSAYGPAPNRDAFAENLALQFAKELELWRDYGLPALITRWQTVAHPEGTAIGVTNSDGTRTEGRFAGLDSMGALRLMLADGTAVTVHAGDVSVI